MKRVASLPLQDSMARSIMRGNARLAETQRQLSTGKKSDTYAGLGADAIRTVTARALLVKTDTHVAVSRQLGTKLTIYDSYLTQMETNLSGLREAVASGLGTQVTVGLQTTLEASFAEFANALNAMDGAEPLFAGSRTDGPVFTPQTLGDVMTTTNADAFQSDTVRQSARVGDTVTVEYGVDARSIGTDVLDAYRTLAAQAPYSEFPTATQLTALGDALAQLDAGLTALRAANGENGRAQNRVETLGLRAETRKIMLSDVISRSEDVNLADVATSLATQKTALEASYSVFSKLSGLNLTNYLR